MPTTITLDGVRSHPLKRFFSYFARPKKSLGCGCDGRSLGDTVPDEVAAAAAASGGSPFAADFTTSAVGWGILSFAVGTLIIRSFRATSKLL
jgi:hypothetical protein